MHKIEHITLPRSSSGDLRGENRQCPPVKVGLRYSEKSEFMQVGEVLGN